MVGKVFPKHVPARLNAVLASGVVLALTWGCVTPPPPPPDDNNPPPPPNGLAASEQRDVFSSQCALNVIDCTTSWPEAVMHLAKTPQQEVFLTLVGYEVTDVGGDGVECVTLRARESVLGVGAAELTYEWSYGASDDDPATLEPGTILSTDESVEVCLDVGAHYIRLYVENDIIRDEIVSTEFGVLKEDAPSFDFVEMEIIILP